MRAMTYKDYTGSAEVSVEDGVVHGKLLGIRDLVTYEADTPAGLRAAFEEAVDDYLADCAEEGREPDRPFKGTFNVRIGADLHRQIALEAYAREMSLNDLITRKVQLANVVQVEVASLGLGKGSPSVKRIKEIFERLTTDVEGLYAASSRELSSVHKVRALRPAKRARHTQQ